MPPPEYIVEAYLEATLALNDPANAKEHAARISVLEKDYGERHRYWEASPLEVSLKQRLTRGAHRARGGILDAGQTVVLPGA